MKRHDKHFPLSSPHSIGCYMANHRNAPNENESILLQFFFIIQLLVPQHQQQIFKTKRWKIHDALLLFMHIVRYHELCTREKHPATITTTTTTNNNNNITGKNNSYNTYKMKISKRYFSLKVYLLNVLLQFAFGSMYMRMLHASAVSVAEVGG